MIEIKYTGDELWARMERAVEKVRIRLERAVQALEQAGILYAVIGGNAVQMWVSQVDEAAVRNTRDVDLLVRREDFPAVKQALESVGFRHVDSFGVTMFLDGENATPRDAVHILFANERVKPGDLAASPDVNEVRVLRNMRAVELAALVQMKLTSFRRKDQVHLLDMLELGLIDASWLTRLPEAMRHRLQELLDSPEG